jgi:hypothetical protein
MKSMSGRPMPGTEKIVSAMTAPAEQPPDLLSDQCHDRYRRIPERVASDHLTGHQSSRPCRTDVLVAEDLDQLAPHLAQQYGRRTDANGDRRQQQQLEVLPGTLGERGIAAAAGTRARR